MRVGVSKHEAPRGASAPSFETLPRLKAGVAPQDEGGHSPQDEGSTCTTPGGG
jgi:hypothetical protein